MKIIAESAYNHNGDLAYLLKLADAAKESGADFFTAQIMCTDAFCVESYHKFKLYKDNEFSLAEWDEVFKHCDELKLDFIPCPLDLIALQFVAKHKTRLVKTHATDITNQPYLEYIVEKLPGTKVILETQASTTFEIRFAEKILRNQIECIVHGFSNYPTDVEHLNLRSLNFLRNEFPDYKIGLADHSLDKFDTPIFALGAQASYLEKHITLSRSDRRFDWQVSLYPREFSQMVDNVRHMEIAAGRVFKHPSSKELEHRTVLFKKYLGDNTFLRSDSGQDFASYKFASFNKKKVLAAVIARQKSDRLPSKCFLPIAGDQSMIRFLLKRISTSKTVEKVLMATSSLPADDELASHCCEDFDVFRGHALSVIDRLLDAAFENQAGAVFRITGDNPLTDPSLVDAMVDLLTTHELDYVRAEGFPFGISAELFSSEYLWNLYLKLENPLVSEYLTWFVLNDADVKYGKIVFDSDQVGKDVSLTNLSVDYKADWEHVNAVLSKFDGDPVTIPLSNILNSIPDSAKIDDSKNMKLPNNVEISLAEYIQRWKNKPFIIEQKFEIK